MKHPYSEDDWADLLQRIVDDEVSSVDLKRLEAILLDDGAKQGEFVDYLLMHDLLDEWLGPEGLIGAVDMLSSDETLPHSPSVVSAGALALETKAERRFSANLVWGLAIALLVAMGTWAYWPIRHQPNRFAKASSDEKHTQNEAIAVARLASGYQVQFSQDKQPEGDSFRAGEYRLERGAAGVIFDNGTKLVVESPAEFTIVNSMSVVLHQGKVRAHVPDAAKGFTISTPDFEVEDLGTEFGVSVLDDKTADVRVFSGKVRLLQEGELLKELAVGSGDSWLQRNGPEIANIRGTSYLTSADLGRRRWNEFKAELLTDPTLVFYLDFERISREPSRVANVVRNDEMSDGVRRGSAIVQGRWPGTKAMLFESFDDSLDVDIPGEYEAFTITAWLQLHSFSWPYQTILNSNDWRQATHHFNIMRNGSLDGGIRRDENKDFENFRIHSSEGEIQVGDWKLVSCVVNARLGQVSYYVDRELVSGSKVELPQSFLTFGPSTIGNWGHTPDFAPGGPLFYDRPLCGRIDDIALYSRPLTAKEISELYRAGNGFK